MQGACPRFSLTWNTRRPHFIHFSCSFFMCAPLSFYSRGLVWSLLLRLPCHSLPTIPWAWCFDTVPAGYFSLFLQFRHDARLVRLWFRCDGGCIFLGFEEVVLHSVAIFNPLIGGRFCCCLGGCCVRAVFSHASLTSISRILREAVCCFKAWTMRLHVALVRPARFINCAKKGLRFCPCFVLFLCLLPLNKFFFGEDVGDVYLLYIDLHFLGVECLHAHVSFVS